MLNRVKRKSVVSLVKKTGLEGSSAVLRFWFVVRGSSVFVYACVPHAFIVQGDQKTVRDPGDWRLSGQTWCGN